MIVEKNPRKGGCQGSGSLAFIMKKFFKQETVVCLSFCFVCFYGYSIWNRNVQNVLWNWRFLEGFVNKIWTAIQRQTNMFHCTSNTCIRKNSGTYLFDEVTTWAKGKHRRCDFANGVLNITTIQSHVASGRVFGRCLHTQEYLPEVIGRIIVLNRR